MTHGLPPGWMRWFGWSKAALPSDIQPWMMMDFRCFLHPLGPAGRRDGLFRQSRSGNDGEWVDIEMGAWEGSGVCMIAGAGLA